VSQQRRIDPFGTVLTWGGLALLVYLVYLVVAPFLVPLGWAAVLAILFYPLHARIAQRRSSTTSAALTTVVAAVILIGPMVSVVTSFAPEALQTATNLQGFLSGLQSSRFDAILREIQSRLPRAVRPNLTSLVNNSIDNLGSFLVAQSGAVAKGLAGFVVDLAIALFATFFLLRDADAIMRGIRRLIPMPAVEREELIARTRELISIGVVSSLVVAAVQGFLGGVVFAILGLAAPLFWGVIMGLCCLLPFGAWVVWLPAALLLAIDGDVTRALILIGLGLGIVSGADNVLRPMMLSGKANMNGLVVFIGLLGGMSVFGLLGLVLGPIVIVTAMALLQTYLESPRREKIELSEP
jgi:predicted PurR-regulated permease PerM